MRIFALCLLFLPLSLASFQASADEESLLTPKAAMVASNPVDVEFFAAQPAIVQPTISPSGKYLAGLVHASGKPLLWVSELFGTSDPFLLSDGQWKIHWFQWISDSELIVSVHVPRHTYGTPIVVSRLVHVDISTRKVKVLFNKDKNPGFEQVQDRVIGGLINEPGNFLIQASKTFPPRVDVYKVNAKSRKLPIRRVEGNQRNIYEWGADVLGNVRAGWGFTGDQKAPVLKLKDSGGKWYDYSHMLSDRDAEVLALPTFDMDVVYLQMFADQGSDLLFAPAANLEADGGEVGPQIYRSVYRFNVRTGEEKKIYGRSDSEVANIVLDPLGKTIAAIVHHNEEVGSEIFAPHWKKAQTTIDKLFPNTQNYIVDISRDRKIALFMVEAPDAPPAFYLYRIADRKIDPLRRAYPALEGVPLGKVFDVSYTARDGLEIPAYLTLPAGLTPEDTHNIPFVVLPHGGPNARDFKRFDWLTQLIVNQGYGVLQMNFRGSTGYGVAYRKAGDKEWGQAMQDDITDGTHWLVEQGMADAGKICIVGGSYGGYAALMGVMKEPDLYRCAVSFNGVSDLSRLVSLANRYIGGRFFSRHIGRLWKDRKMLANNSPINLVANLKAPVLLVHGEKDRVVDIRQSKKMAKVLNRQKPGLSEFVELPDGDHYLSGYENRITFAKTMTEFLQSHLNPQTTLSVR